MNRRNQSPRVSSGFTLFELVIANALAAVLMVGVMSVVSVVARDRQRFASRSRQPSEPRRIVDLLHRDLVNARTVKQDGRGLRLLLEGYGAVDPETLCPDGRAAQVEYRVETHNDRHWLVRTQKYLDDKTNAKPWRELVCGGVDRLALEQRDIHKANEKEPPQRKPEMLDDPQLTGGGARSAMVAISLSDEMILRIRFDDESVPAIEEELMFH